MHLKGVLFSLQDLNISRPQDPERFVLEDALAELLDNLPHNGIQAINLDAFQAATSEMLQAILSLHHLSAKECLLIAATDRILSMADGMELASIGYINPTFPRQSLRQPEILIEGFDEVDFYFLEQVYKRKHNIPWTVIETKRCILREMTLDDLDALYGLYHGEGITRYLEPMYEDREKEEAYTRAYIQNMYRFYGYGIWIAMEKSTGNIIGRAGVHNQNVHGEAILELGYIVGKPYQRQGYATELCQGILEFARQETGFSEINCLIEKGNEISIHLAEKLGFSWFEEVENQGKTLQRYKKSLQF